jgi:hypothetical protein
VYRLALVTLQDALSRDLPLTLRPETGKICVRPGAALAAPELTQRMTILLNTALASLPVVGLRAIVMAPLLLAFIFEHSDKREGLYNILWALVFGFATLNILGLLTRRSETGRQRLSFGEITAILVVGLSVLLLAWEMLGLFKIFPIKLGPH